MERMFYHFCKHSFYAKVPLHEWKLRSIKQIEEEQLINCHDAAHYFEEKLKEIDDITDICLYYVVFRYSDEHSLVTFKHNGFYYIIERTMKKGIHGPFKDLYSLFRFVAKQYISEPVLCHIYKHNNVPEGTDYENYIRLAKGELVYPLPITSSEFIKVHVYDDSISVIFMGNERALYSLRRYCKLNSINNAIFRPERDNDAAINSFLETYPSIFHDEVCIIMATASYAQLAISIAMNNYKSIQVVLLDVNEYSVSNVLVFPVISKKGSELKLSVHMNRYTLVYYNDVRNFIYPEAAQLLIDTFVLLK